MRVVLKLGRRPPIETCEPPLPVIYFGLMTVTPYAPRSLRVGRERPDAGERGRVLSFRRSGLARKPQAPVESPAGLPALIPDMGQYERAGIQPDDYRHRMIVNTLGFAVCILLIVAGVWLANKIADLRRDQDCVLSGRRNCAQISIIGNVNR